mgnify:CR=1 FL=1
MAAQQRHAGMKRRALPLARQHGNATFCSRAFGRGGGVGGRLQGEVTAAGGGGEQLTVMGVPVYWVLQGNFLGPAQQSNRNKKNEQASPPTRLCPTRAAKRFLGCMPEATPVYRTLS